MDIAGDLTNIKASILDRLQALYSCTIPTGQLFTRELNEELLAISTLLNRETAVYINRQGRIIQVSVGDTATVELPDFKSRATVRLSGVRCIHTHPSGDTRLSTPDLSSLRRMRFDAMVAIGSAAGHIIASAAFFTGDEDADGLPGLQGLGPVPASDLSRLDLTRLTAKINKKLASCCTTATASEEDIAIICGLDRQVTSRTWGINDSLDELARLAATAGATVVGRFTQKKGRPDAALFFGRGKVQEISMALQNANANTLIVDDELSPSQQHNLENQLGIKIIDRTALILDIFAQRARSSAGCLQVELAQLKYNLPRLSGQGLALSRLGGGIGTRGPGETKLEVDRRRIHKRIHDLEDELAKLAAQRRLNRAARTSTGLPRAALVGYTNAGKSTLLNALTDAGVFAEDKLFATLDPTTRLVTLPQNQQLLLTDTVGFIQKLPHTLVTAFHATLEEVQEADLLLHVVDCSNDNYRLQIDTVNKVLDELHAGGKPTLYILNKADLLPEAANDTRMLNGCESVFISAGTGWNISLLLEKLSATVRARQAELTLTIPFAEGQLITRLHGIATILDTSYTAAGTVLKVRLPAAAADEFRPYCT